MKIFDIENKSDEKIITYFMIDSIFEAKDINSMKYSAENFPLLHNRIVFVNTHFHDDWNWLMQVVEKIEKMGWVFEPEFKDGYYHVDMGKSRGVFMFGNFSESRIEVYYKTVVEFIKWYNRNR